MIDSGCGTKGTPDRGTISEKKLPFGRSISITFLLAIKFSGVIVIDNIEFPKLPTPFLNIINGGKHGVTEDLKIQEFMIFANEELSPSVQVRIYCEVYHNLKKILDIFDREPVALNPWDPMGSLAG